MKVVAIAAALLLGGFVVILGAGFLFIRHKVGTLGGLLGGVVALPPFRIRLVPSAEAPWHDIEAADELTAGLHSLGYECVGDFEIPEMEGLALRGFRHPEIDALAAVSDVENVGVFGEVVMELFDGSQLTVTSGPRTGLDHPEARRVIYIEADSNDSEAAHLLHERLLEEARGRETMLIDSSFEHAFTDAYEREMNWRIERGGVTADEIRREAELAGRKAPADAAVELIRATWQGAIDEFIQEETRRAWLAESRMSLADWEHERDRFVVVHECGGTSERIDELAWAMIDGTIPEDDEEAEERAWEAARNRLRPEFEGRTTREGFAEAQRLLSEKRRYELIGSLEEPWPADCYLVPEALRPI